MLETRKFLVGAAIFTVLLSSGCIQPEVEEKIVCNKPYILVGGECCLDQNGNKICDLDEDEAETTTTIAPVTTTLISSTTTVTVKKEETKPDTCSLQNDSMSRDACYLALAIDTGNRSMCEMIERDITKSLCLEETQVETGGRSTTIEGYVMNKTTSVVIPGIRIVAISKTSGEEEGSTTTNSQGFYSMKVPARDTYLLVLGMGDGEFKKEVYAKKGWTHEIWFRI